jgi:hypothetical protein
VTKYKGNRAYFVRDNGAVMTRIILLRFYEKWDLVYVLPQRQRSPAYDKAYNASTFPLQHQSIKSDYYFAEFPPYLL